MKKNILILFILMLVGCGNDYNANDTNNINTEVKPISTPKTYLVITPQSTNLAIGLSQQYLAKAYYEDSKSGELLDITSSTSINWTSTNESIASVSNDIDSKGLVTGESAGTVMLFASIKGTDISDSVEVKVKDVDVSSISLVTSPASDSVPKGIERQFQAIAYLSDGSSLNITNDNALIWSSSDNTIATVSNLKGRKGVAIGASQGDVSIKASGSANGVHFSGTAPLKVTDAVINSIKIHPDNVSVYKGLHANLYARAYFSDGSFIDVTNDSNFKWSSSDNTIASITPYDKVKGDSIGVATITITSKDNAALSDNVQIEVLAEAMTKIETTPSEVTIPLGLHHNLKATAHFTDGSIIDITDEPGMIWQSNDERIISLSLEQGLVNAISEGTAEVTASFSLATQTPFKASSQIHVSDAVVTALAVTPNDIEIPQGNLQNYEAIASLSDGSTANVTDHEQTTWAVSDTSFGTISKNGVFNSKVNVSGKLDIIASISSSGSTIQSSSQLQVLRNFTTSPVYGSARAYDDKLNYLLGPSNNMLFSCGEIVDAMGTPEIGYTGGSGGKIETIDVTDISSITVNWAYWVGTIDTQHQPAISAITITYNDGGLYQCGTESRTFDATSETWRIPSGEVFYGFSVSAQRYVHSLQIISRTR